MLLKSRKGLLIYLDGLIPSKKNSRVTNRKTGRSFPSAKYREWHKTASKQLPELNVAKAKVHIHLFFGTLGIADMTNKAESIMDLLVDNKTLLDDNWKVCNDMRLTARYRKRMPGAIVRIEAKSKGDA